jgi:regulator of protease activity HflC (stomatin/prohibitin superfamily)
MIQQIEKKVVNRLRQVTSAIRQDGANQVSIIRSTAERQAAIELARAAAQRPRIVGDALREICAKPEVAEAMFAILETQKALEGDHKELTILPRENSGGLLTDMLASRPAGSA